MKKALCLFASFFYAVCIFLIPVLFFMFTDPTATNLFLASLLSVISGLVSYDYFLTYKSK